MIKTLWLKNFGPYENAKVPFDEFNAVVGANGSGKSFLFTALRALGRVARYPTRYAASSPRGSGYSTRTGQVQLSDLVHKGDKERVVTLGAEFCKDDLTGTYEVELRAWKNPGGMIVAEKLDVEFRGKRWWASADDDAVDGNLPMAPSALRAPRFLSIPCSLYKSKDQVASDLGRELQSILWDRLGVVRLDPTALKSPSAINERMTPVGFNFATYLDEIQNGQGAQEEWAALISRFTQICPHVRDVRLPVDPTFNNDEHGPRKRIHLVMSASGSSIPADLESDGTMLLLAYVALLHGSRAYDTLCIEEPENGINAAVMPKLVGALQELTRTRGNKSGSQIVLCSHSAPLLTEVMRRPENIRLVRRNADGRSTVELIHPSKLPMVLGWAGATAHP